MIGGSLPVTLAANWLAAAWDQNTGLYRPTPGTAFLEQVALRWRLEVLGLPRECGGAFVTGAAVAPSRAELVTGIGEADSWVAALGTHANCVIGAREWFS